MANTTAERGVTPPKSGPLLPFRRNTQPESALRATLLNPKPLVAHAKAPKDASHSILSRTRRASTSLGHPPESKGKERDFFNGKTSNESSSNSPETGTLLIHRCSASLQSFSSSICTDLALSQPIHATDTIIQTQTSILLLRSPPTSQTSYIYLPIRLLIVIRVHRRRGRAVRLHRIRRPAYCSAQGEPFLAPPPMPSVVSSSAGGVRRLRKGPQHYHNPMSPLLYFLRS